MDKNTFKSKTLRELSETELRTKLADLKKSLFELRQKSHVQTLEKPHLVQQTRRAIARIATLLHEEKNTKKA